MKKQKPPLYIKMRGNFGRIMFLDRIKEGFTKFNFRNEIFLKIEKEKILVFLTDRTGTGKYFEVNKENFLHVYKNRNASSTFKRALMRTLKILDANSEKIAEAIGFERLDISPEKEIYISTQN